MQIVVLETKTAKAATLDILTTHCIPSAMSDDLKTWVKILGKVQKITPLVILAVHHLLGPTYLLHYAGVFINLCKRWIWIIGCWDFSFILIFINFVLMGRKSGDGGEDGFPRSRKFRDFSFLFFILGRSLPGISFILFSSKHFFRFILYWLMYYTRMVDTINFK